MATNAYAWKALHGSMPELAVDELTGSCSEEAFLQRIQAIPAGQRDYALAIYANAIASRLSLLERGGDDAVAL